MTEFEKLQKVLETDSPDGVVDLAVTRIQELKADSEAKQKKTDELEKAAKDSSAKIDALEAELKKKSATIAGDAKALLDENEKLKAENEKLKVDSQGKTDAVKKLNDDVEGLKTKTDAIGKKQVKKLWNDSDNEIDELKAKRLNMYADSRGGK